MTCLIGCNISLNKERKAPSLPVNHHLRPCAANTISWNRGNVLSPRLWSYIVSCCVLVDNPLKIPGFQCSKGTRCSGFFQMWEFQWKYSPHSVLLFHSSTILSQCTHFYSNSHLMFNWNTFQPSLLWKSLLLAECNATVDSMSIRNPILQHPCLWLQTCSHLNGALIGVLMLHCLPLLDSIHISSMVAR